MPPAVRRAQVITTAPKYGRALVARFMFRGLPPSLASFFPRSLLLLFRLRGGRFLFLLLEPHHVTRLDTLSLFHDHLGILQVAVPLLLRVFQPQDLHLAQ